MQCTEDFLSTDLFFIQHDEVLKALNIVKWGAAVFVGTTWQETGASVVLEMVLCPS